jgi:hemoglobin-like flavoprotein
VTPHQIALVQQGMRRLAAHGAFFARNFYGALFALDPALRPVFHCDLAQQGTRLVQMLQLAVDGLAHFDELAPTLRALGRRHAAYGVRPYDFETLGHALMCAIARQPDAAVDETARAAWRAAYERLAREIQRGVAESAPPQRRPDATTTPW